jgi:GTP-binding protein
VFYADPHMSTLLDFKYQRFYRAENGEPARRAQYGQKGKPSHSRAGRTIVRDVESGAILAT